MTDESEDTFADTVRDWLDTTFPTGEIHDQPYLDTTQRFPDFLVALDHVTIVVEVENDWNAVLGGIGQVEIYDVSIDGPVWRLVVVPAPTADGDDGHIDTEELRRLQTRSDTAVITL